MINVEEMKADFLSQYGREICKSGIAGVKAATDVPSFIKVLFDNIDAMGVGMVPKLDWVRKWFGEHKSEANACGCYIDQIVPLTDKHEKVICFGDCNVIATFAELKMHHLYLQHNTKASINAIGWSMTIVRCYDNASAVVSNKTEHSRINIFQR